MHHTFNLRLVKNKQHLLFLRKFIGPSWLRYASQMQFCCSYRKNSKAKTSGALSKTVTVRKAQIR